MRSKSDISNSALRIFLQEVGKFYDSQRGFDPFVPKKKQKSNLLEYFDYKCCYCGVDIDESTISQDHLIPMNKEHLGLHAWGNVVPCCRSCNNKKQQAPWDDFLKGKADGKEYTKRKKQILFFVSEMKYDPNLNLHDYADNLYHDVGEVALTLINLRYMQAEEKIRTLVSKRG